jgi:putative sterol carrier protein
MTSVADAVKAMKAKFNPAAAAGLDLVFGFNIDEDKHYSLVVKDSTCESGRRKPGRQLHPGDGQRNPEGIVSGETDGMQAFMGGKLRVEGDMMLSMKLSELFPS